MGRDAQNFNPLMKKARKDHICTWDFCGKQINKGDYYINETLLPWDDENDEDKFLVLKSHLACYHKAMLMGPVNIEKPICGIDECGCEMDLVSISESESSFVCEQDEEHARTFKKGPSDWMKKTSIYGWTALGMKGIDTMEVAKRSGP